MKKVFTTLVLFQFFVCSFSQVNPLLQTSWGQNCFYNDSCPSMTGGYCGKAVTGCVATATAQILKYYSYPTSGMGSHCNYHFPTNCVNFSKETYDYTIMSNSLTSSDPEVAKLMYDVGVSVDMLWGATESTAGDMSVPMKSYFGYSPKMYYQPVSSIDTTTLIQKIKTELDAGRPVIIVSFTGDHDYIIDGYNSTNGFHCNFGWAGL